MNFIVRFLILMIFIISLASSENSKCCAMCIGKLEKNSPAFFADEYYQATEADIIDTQTIAVTDQIQTTTLASNQEEPCAQ